MNPNPSSPSSPAPSPIIMWRDMRIDELEGGLPELTITSPSDGEVRTYRLAPDAVTALVDGLSGVAKPAAGECRIIVKCDADVLVKALAALRTDAPSTNITLASELGGSFGAALARLSAYRIALIALWPPADDESPASHSARKAEAMAGEIKVGAEAMLAAVGRGEL